MRDFLIYFGLGLLTTLIVFFNRPQEEDGVLGFPKSVFTAFEYFLLIVCWPLVFIMILGIKIYNLLKDKIL